MFGINFTQARRITEWQEEHECSVTNEGAIGGQYTYMFTPTSMGEVLQVECACGSKIDVTEYDLW